MDGLTLRLTAIVVLVVTTVAIYVLLQVGMAHARCEEDQPCWNCKTMGNHICGTP
jgi:hypothetical protein